MLPLILRRLVQMVLIMAVASFILFLIFDSDQFKKKIAVAELGGFAVSALTEESYHNWLAEKGLDEPFYERYAHWVGDVLRGHFGKSFEKNTAVGPLLADRLLNTGILAFWVFALMIPISLVTGVLAGMKEGSAQDRAITVLSVITTSIPEIATAIILTVVLALGLGWLPAKSAMINGFNWKELVLPVLTLVLYDFGYVARMTRASMAEVMTSQYIRTAVLKGIPVSARDHEARAAQRADRAVHGDRAAAQLAALGRGRGRGVLRVRRLRQAAAAGGAVRRRLRRPGLHPGRGDRGGAVADHLGRRLHLLEPAHPVRLRRPSTMATAIATAAARRPP